MSQLASPVYNGYKNIKEWKISPGGSYVAWAPLHVKIIYFISRGKTPEKVTKQHQFHQKGTSYESPIILVDILLPTVTKTNLWLHDSYNRNPHDILGKRSDPWGWDPLHKNRSIPLLETNSWVFMWPSEFIVLTRLLINLMNSSFQTVYVAATFILAMWHCEYLCLSSVY